MSQAGVELGSELQTPAPDDLEIRFGTRRGQPVERGPATSNPPRRGAPAETAARI
jgi:hypothetical protein